MPNAAAQASMPAWAQWISKYTTLIVPISLIALLGVIIVPLHPMMMDILIAGNIALAAVVLLTTVYVTSPLEFSVFPSLLLATTLFRLVLNVASTRLILSADAATPEAVTGVAGEVIESFGGFVAGGNVIVGLIIFIILIVVQFVVITKGSTRISEVAARFTLDGMPGKQMAIDADLNAGIINESQARERRDSITREADFYGAMDGASKFVRGDAIAGIIITLINIAGGFAIGMFDKNWDMVATLEAFTKLTIGDGLVSQIPSFIISIAAGLIVTRSSSKADLGNELTGQLTSRPIALGITAGFLVLMMFTGLPVLPMFTLAATLGITGWVLHRRTATETQQAQDAAKAEQAKPAGPPPVEKQLVVDTMELTIGYALVKLADKSQGGDLLDRIANMRRDLAKELGIIVPPISIRDNMLMQPYEYKVMIRGNAVASGTAYPDQFLAIDSGIAQGKLNGIETTEPAFGQNAWWVAAGERERAETLNYIVADPATVMATHITEIIKSHADELLTREETNNLIEQLKERTPKLVEEVIPEVIKPGEMQKILQALLRERVAIRDMETILETVSDWAARTKDLDVLTEYARNALRRSICNQYIEPDAETGASRLYCVTLDPQLEDMVNGYIERNAAGTSMAMPPAVANGITASVLNQLQKLIAAGHHPVVLASPQVRAQVRQLLEPHLSNVAVLGYNEVSKGVEVESMGLVTLDTSPSSPRTELEGAVN